MRRRSELPPSLERFGHDLRDAAHEQIQRERAEASPRRRSRRRALLATVLAVLLPAGALAVAGALDDDAPPRPADPDLPESIRPGTDPTVVVRSATPDPAGGLPWALKLFNNPAGEQCVAVGRLRQGILGQIERGRFHPFPRSVNGVCGDIAASGLLYGVERRRAPAPRTVVYGISGGNRPVVLQLDGRRYSVTPRTLGTFIIVLEGQRDLGGGEISTTAGGRRIKRALD